MNVIPWQRRESLLPTSSDLESFVGRLLPDGNRDLMSHLPKAFQLGNFPPINIAEAEECFTVSVDCPGMAEEDFQIEAMGNQLMVSGERKWEEEKQGKEFKRVESQYGLFERTVVLPDNVRIDAETIDARYAKGVLTIVVPKLEKTPAAKIRVRGEGTE